jgi:preprotein translocase subunit SecA
MALTFLKGIFGGDTAGNTKRFAPLVDKINALEEDFASLSQAEIQKKTEEFKSRIKGGETLDALLPEAFALVREASKRTLGERHFDVQLIGGMVLHEGGIAEMRTGEGKTIMATLPAYLNALTGKGVHVVTVNDYLSRRDTVWMGQIYSYLGLSVSGIGHDSSFLYDPNHGTDTSSDSDSKDNERDSTGSFHVVHEFLRPVTRREAYAADITYGTNNEFGFDYLRDNIEYSDTRLRQREHAFAIVDEIDSILIDEARTPLIISSPTTESGNLYQTFSGIAKGLEKDVHFNVDEKFRQITLTDEGINAAEKALGVENIYTDGGIKYVHHLETAVKAKALYERDRHYVVRDGEVVIVDEFTGRMQPGRRWSEGLHQAVEAKEGVDIQKESRTFASITFQNYFRMYDKLSGMTGTAETSAEEFYKVYGLSVTVVPTNKPIARKDLNDLIFQTEIGKFQAVARKIKELQENGQPVLVGTASIDKNELLSQFLTREGVRHEVLNAKNHEREGEIVAQAGRVGAVTIATNMAGRGVDIKLGGNPASEDAYEKVKNLNGLFVLGTERHEARRIDNQLRGRSGRQGDPGTTQFFVSLEDNLMRIFASDTIKKMMGKIGIAEDQPIENKLITNSLEKAQERIEGFHFDARKNVLQYDDVLNFQRTTIYEKRRAVLLGGSSAVFEYLEGILLGASPEEREAVEKKRQELGEEHFAKVLQMVILQTTDMFWVDHLEMMDYLRGSVNLRAYGQRDPLVEYKREGLRLFKEMEENIGAEILKLLPRINSMVPTQEEKNLKEVRAGAEVITHEKNNGAGSAYKGVGRNDPCPCGKKKEDGTPVKFKHCHGKDL